MISFTILFLSGTSRFMDEHVKKLRLLLKFAMRVLSQLLSDLWAYYSSPYPLLLIVGVLRRIIRRANTLWQAKGRGRPSVGEDVVELILDMKRSNWSWGAARAFLKNYFYLASMYTRRPSNGYYLKMAWSRQKLALHLQLGQPS